MNNLAQVPIGDSFAGKGVPPALFPFLQLDSVSKLVTVFLNASFVIAGLVLLFFFILGGIGMIGSAGKNDPKAAEQAKQTITSALIGFIVVFTSYWIVKLIGTILDIPIL